MHYRQICAQLTHSARLCIVGKNPANTLRTRFASDDRIERVGRGIFWLKGHEIISDGQPAHCDACEEFDGTGR